MGASSAGRLAAWHTIVEQVFGRVIPEVVPAVWQRPRGCPPGFHMLIAVASLVLITGCNTAAPALTPSQSTLPTAAPLATTAPTPDSKVAAAAYLEAVTAYNTAMEATAKPCRVAGLDAGRQCQKLHYEALEILVGAVRAITPPSDAVADIRDVLKAMATLDTYLRDAAGAKTLAELQGWYTSIDRAHLAVQSASNLVRADLGLPPISVP